MEEITRINAGYIGAFFGIDCASGDTFTSPSLNASMTSMYVPEPVISMAIKPSTIQSEQNMSKALNRFTKEDPTFKSYVNKETGETIISGMGELHLEIYLERMKREYNAEITAGEPSVAYRETITCKSDFDYIHKKQTGGSGQYGRIVGHIEPIVDEEYIFENRITGGSIPTQYIPACEKGFKACLEKGPWMKYPVTGVKIVITDGASHSVDSSDMAFQAAARGAFLQGYLKARPVLLEPIMKVVVETPGEFQGNVMGSLNQRRGIIIGSHDVGHMTAIEAQVPLAEMFGYSTALRSMTQGKAQFTMEFATYKQVPQQILDVIQKKNEKKVKNGSSF
jgi:elongation factor G